MTAPVTLLAVTLADEIACIRRELEDRKVRYATWVQTGIMTREQAVQELTCMNAVLTRLQGLLAFEEATRHEG